MNIQPIGFVDVSLMTANFLLRYKGRFADSPLRAEHPGSPHHDTESIILRGPQELTVETWGADVPQTDYPILKDWKSAKALLQRIRNAVTPFNGGLVPDLGKAMVVSLKSGGHVDWHTDEGAYAEAHHRFHICLVPSPGAVLYSGPEVRTPPVGELTFFNNRVKHSAANFGTLPRIHLIVDTRKVDA